MFCQKIISPDGIPQLKFYNGDYLLFNDGGYSELTLRRPGLITTSYEASSHESIIASIRSIMDTLEPHVVHFEVPESGTFCFMPLADALHRSHEGLDFTVRDHTERGLYILLTYFQEGLQLFESSFEGDAIGLYADDSAFNSEGGSCLTQFFIALYQLHDIGKNYVYEYQHESSESIIRSLSRQGSLPLSTQSFEVMMGLLFQDLSFYSDFLKNVYTFKKDSKNTCEIDAIYENGIKAQKSIISACSERLLFSEEVDLNILINTFADKIIEKSKEFSLSPIEFYRLMITYFQIDTLAYTNLAPNCFGRYGKIILDPLYKLNEHYDPSNSEPLFEFNRAKGRFVFSSNIEPLFIRLEEKLQEATN
jgi:hypothetical protein